MRLFYLLKSTQVGKTTDFTDFTDITDLYNYYNNSKNSDSSFMQYEMQETITEPTNDDFSEQRK